MNPKLTDVIDRATKVIAKLPFDSRAGWAIYFLESLDASLKASIGEDNGFDRIACEIMRTLSDRLETGEW